jgi:hypothetical protein
MEVQVFFAAVFLQNGNLRVAVFFSPCPQEAKPGNAQGRLGKKKNPSGFVPFNEKGQS